jgi:hypothetical protein
MYVKLWETNNKYEKGAINGGNGEKIWNKYGR